MKAFLVVLFVLASAIIATTTATTAAVTVDLMRDVNQKLHATDFYRAANGKLQADHLILRRNAAFTVKVLGVVKPTFSLQLDCSPLLPQPNQKETVDLKVVSVKGDVYTLNFVDGAIGNFSLLVKDPSKKVVAALSRVIFLANPLSPKDHTYIDKVKNAGGFKAGQPLTPTNAVTVEEHVYNERGAVWQGSSQQNAWKAWAYNQKDMLMLQTTLYLLDMGKLTLKQRAQTHLVVRWLSLGTQSILWGRWDGKYGDGKQPGYWSSSTQIVKQFFDTKQQAVKYGQCWVFAGLLTALTRTIGVPSRPLTNFNSAHEHSPFDQKCVSKYKLAANGEDWDLVESDNSIWNFHVWVDAWLSRPDLSPPLPPHWNAIDATPQEYSGSVLNEAPFNTKDYFTGPASLILLERGDYRSNFDNAFVGGETNCEVVNMLDRGTGKFEVVSTSKTHVGEQIVTKLDDQWCNGEAWSSKDEYTALCKSNLARAYSKPGTFVETGNSSSSGAASWTVSWNKEIKPGKPFAVTFKPSEQVSQQGGAYVYGFTIFAASYRGDRLKSGNKHIVLYRSGKKDAPDVKGRKEFHNPIEADFWKQDLMKDTLGQTSTFLLQAWAFPKDRTKSSHADFFYEQKIALRMPLLGVMCGRKGQQHKLGEQLKCAAFFYNPLPYSLSRCTLSMSISGQSLQQEAQVNQQLQKKAGQVSVGVQQNSEAEPPSSNDAGSNIDDIKKLGDLGGGRHVFGGFQWTLSGSPGKHVVIAKLNCHELADITGSAPLTIVGSNTSADRELPQQSQSGSQQQLASQQGTQQQQTAGGQQQQQQTAAQVQQQQQQRQQHAANVARVGQRNKF